MGLLKSSCLGVAGVQLCMNLGTFFPRNLKYLFRCGGLVHVNEMENDCLQFSRQLVCNGGVLRYNNIDTPHETIN